MEFSSLNEYSLWLEPTGEDYEKLSLFAKKLQKIVGCPNFSPHITLLANIPLTQTEIESRMVKLPKKSFGIKFNNVSTGENPLKSLFLECVQSPELIELNNLAQKIYGMNTTYLPHMSFIYGKLEENLKKELVEKIRKQNIDFFSFEVKNISLWHAMGTIENWKKIKEISFS